MAAISNLDESAECFRRAKEWFDSVYVGLWYNCIVLEGRCRKCGCCYVGWSLRFPRNQTCSNCGAALELYEDGKRLATGYSPFTADKYTLKSPDADRAQEPADNR